jgi:hypothetical protein
MNIPEGLTEEEVLRVLRKVANEKKKTWRFGYHGEDDIYQQIHMHCIKVLNAGKFVPRGEKPLVTQLLNFLRVHTRNKLSSDIRNTMYRYAQPESKNNKTRWNLMHTLKIYSQNLEHSEIFAFDSDMDTAMDREELIRKIRAGLDINQLKDFLKLQNGVNISKKKKELLIERIREILGDDFYAA